MHGLEHCIPVFFVGKVSYLSIEFVVEQAGGADDVDSDQDVSGYRKNKNRLSDDNEDENRHDVEEDDDEYDSEEDEDYDDRPKKKKKRNAVSKFIVDEAGKHILSVSQYVT